MTSTPSALRRISAAFGLAALAGCAPATPDVSRSATPPIGQFLTIDGKRVHAAVQGTGPAVILIHGASGNLRDMTFDLAPRLARRGFKVISFDRPGLGYSEKLHNRGESPQEQARHLARAADALGVSRAVVLGQSYGGAVAMAWALERPDQVAAVVNLAGATMPWPGGLGPMYGILGSRIGGAVAAPLIAGLTPISYARQAVGSIFAPDEVPEGYAEYVGVDLTLRADVLRANARQVNTLRPHVVAMAERYASLRLPVEILHGDADTTVPLEVHSRRLVTLIPGARLTVLEGVGHMPHHARADQTVAAVLRAAGRAGLRPGTASR